MGIINEFAEEKPASDLIPILTFKFRRWWHNRWKHPPCLQRVAPPNVLNITVELFEEVGDDKGLSKNESDSFPIMTFIIFPLQTLLLSDLLYIFVEDRLHLGKTFKQA